MVERAVQMLEGQVRTMVLALESKIDKTINADDNILPWLISYAGVLINRFHVGPDNKTAHERLRGRTSKRELVEFGEQNLYYVPTKTRIDMDGRWLLGTFLGRSPDCFVGVPNGAVVRARSIARVVAER